MKFVKPALFAVVLGAVTLAAGKVSAFPLYLTSFNGSLSTTPSFSAIHGTNVAKITRVSFNLKTVMTVVSNQVHLDSGTNVPADARIAYDAYTDSSFLTNSSGFHYDLDGIVSLSIPDLAASFHVTSTGITESDVARLSLDIVGHGPDGTFSEFKVSGQGGLAFSAKGSAGKMSLFLAGGADYGEYKNSDDGVARGGFKFTGNGAPEWSGPFSTWWWQQ